MLAYLDSSIHLGSEGLASLVLHRSRFLTVIMPLNREVIFPETKDNQETSSSFRNPDSASLIGPMLVPPCCTASFRISLRVLLSM